MAVIRRAAARKTGEEHARATEHEHAMNDGEGARRADTLIEWIQDRIEEAHEADDGNRMDDGVTKEERDWQKWEYDREERRRSFSLLLFVSVCV